MSMIDFVDWLGSCLREECCFHFSLLIVAFCCPLYMPSVLGCVFLSGTVNIIFASLSKKEKKKIKVPCFLFTDLINTAISEEIWRM